MNKFSSALIFSLFLLAVILTAGCTSPTDTGEPLIPPPKADLSGSWYSTESYHMYGDGEILSSDILSRIKIEQHGRVFYITGSIIDGTGVAVFCNEEGTNFMSDISTDTFRGVIFGEVRGEEIWISYTGIFTKKFSTFKSGDVFEETYRYVREGQSIEDTFVFTELKQSYPFAKGFILSQDAKYDLNGEEFTVDKQYGGIISGTVKNYINGENAELRYTGGAIFTSVDQSGIICEYYMVIDNAGRFWLLGHYPSSNAVAIMTVNIASYPSVAGQTVAEFELYGENMDYSDEMFGVTPMNVLGEWKGVAATKIKADKIEEEFYPGSANALNQADIMFTGTFTSGNVPSIDVAGAVLSPASREIFIAAPRASDENSVFIVRGWVEGDTMYVCGIYESFGVKTATVEVLKHQ